MAIYRLIGLCFLIFICNSVQLKYDEVVSGSGGSVFEFIPLPTGFSVIAASSTSPVLLFVRKSKAPSSTEYDLKSTTSLILSSLDPTSTYFLSVQSSTPFTLLLENTEYKPISPNLPIRLYIQESSQHLYSFNASTLSKDLKISLIYFVGKAKLLVSPDDPIPSNSIAPENWEFGQIVQIKSGSVDLVKISVIGLTNTDYTLLVDSGDDITISDQEISGLVEENMNEFYKFQADQSQLVRIKLSIFSGDCDLYLKVGQRPSFQDFDWKFTDHGSKIVELSPSDQSVHPGSDYFLAVYGRKSSAFVLSVQNHHKPISVLTSGFPSIGLVESQGFEYFSITLDTNSELSIHLSAVSGNPDLYAKFCNTTKPNCFFTIHEIANPENTVFYSNHTFGLEEVSVKGTGELLVAVLGASDLVSEFTIVAVVNNQEVLLKSGTPQSSTIADKGYRYYKYKLAKWSASSVQFLLTPVSGNPDLYVSRTEQPSVEEYDSSSVNSGLEIDSITYSKGKDYESLNGTYYIAVYAAGPAQFSIVAKENHPGGNTTVLLYPGLPQKDTFYSYCMRHRLYYFPTRFTEENKQPIKVSITAITGKFLLAVTNKIEHIDFERRIFWYHWATNSSNHELANSIQISTDDPYYLLKSNYAVLVQTLEFGSDNTATYSIVLRIGDDLVLLSDNSPLSDLVASNSYNFYTFPVTLSREDVTVKLTAFTGSPQIYVSVNNTHPNASDYQFSSVRKSSNELLLAWKDLKAKCPVLPDTYHHGNSSSCNLYIGVSSTNASQYSISVHASQQSASLVIIPSTLFSVLSDKPRHYYGFPNSTQDLLIDCQTSIGEAKFYVQIVSSIQADISDVEFPSRTDNYLESEVYMIHSQRAKIRHQDFARRCEGKCMVLVTVECGEIACEYSISVTQDNVVNLADGESFLGSVKKDGYSYFSYYCGSADHDFVVSVSPMDSGDPDLYIKKSTSALPSKTEFQWKAQTSEGETLIISRSDPVLQALNTTIRGTYLIAVFGKSACSFTIRLTQDPKPIKKILSGIPEHAVVASGEYAYFYYRSSITSDILITVTPISGKAVIYANTQQLYVGELYENLPSASNYIYSSVSDKSQYSLLISQESQGFCVSCNIKIAVLCPVDCEFSIQVGHKMKISLLQNGVPTRSDIGKKSWMLFYFEVNTASDIDFSLTTFSGDPDLFINTEIDISFSNAKWTSLAISDYEHITISRDDKNFIKGGYYVGVYSNMPSTFAITAHIKNSFVKLISGLPSSYSISPYTTMYFQFSYKSVVNQNVYCNLHPEKENNPEVFVKFQTEQVYPGPGVFDFHYTSSDYKVVYSGLYTKFTVDPDFKVFLGVKAGESLSSFTLSCSGEDDATILKLNNEIFDTLNKDMDKKLYEVNVEQKGILSVFVVPCQYEQEIRISSNWTLERKDDPDIVVNRMTDGVLAAVMNNAQGRYYVEVSRKGEVRNDASYVITSYFSASGQRQVVVPGNYGKIRMSYEDNGVLLKWEKPVYENLTAFAGDVTYFVYLLDNPYHVTACSIMMSRDEGNSMVLQETKKTEYLFGGKKQSFVNLVAVLPLNVKSFRFLPYDAVQVKPDDGKSGRVVFWVWVLLVVVAFVMIGILMIIRRTKRVRERIDIELTVARNLPAPGSEKVRLSNDM